MSTPTDDLEAACKLVREALAAYGEQMDMRYECDKAGEIIGRSLAHPPTSELVEAAQAVVERWDSPLWKDVPHTGEFINRLRRALSAHPKEVAPTVEETVDELMELLEDYIEEGIEEMHDHSSDHGWQYDRGHPNWNATMDDLRARLTKLLTTP